jgi:hypothetical protein
MHGNNRRNLFPVIYFNLYSEDVSIALSIQNITQLPGSNLGKDTKYHYRGFLLSLSKMRKGGDFIMGVNGNDILA